MSNAIIESDIRSCKRSLHKWRQANRVFFDAGNEQSMVISTTEPSGGSAKVLRIDFDNKLILSTTAHKCAIKVAWKTLSLFRVRGFYLVSDLLLLYNSHVLSHIEYRTAGLHFVSTSVFNEFGLQSPFLRLPASTTTRLTCPHLCTLR